MVVTGDKDGVDKLRRQVERDAKALAGSMKKLHGGWWKIYIDHETGLAAVSRDYSPASFNS